MTSKRKVLDFILSNLKKLDAEWMEKLEDINIWNDVCSIYNIVHANNSRISNLEGNTILAFIVLSYDNASEYLEPHKDRFDNKVKIMDRLTKGDSLSNDVYNDVVYGNDDICNPVINWYIDYQKDWRWKQVLVVKEYAAKTMARALNTDEEITKAINDSKTLNMEADQMLDVLRTEFLTLDTILGKEKKPAATEISLTNFMSHEGFIRARNKRREEEKQEAEREKLLEKERKKNPMV